jgi:hypothetical protein
LAAVNACLAGNGAGHGADFVQGVTDLFAHDSANAGQVEEALHRLWEVLIEKAEGIAWDDAAQDRLAGLLQEIKLLPPPAQPAPQVWGLSLWGELPLFGASMRERWDLGPGEADARPRCAEGRLMTTQARRPRAGRTSTRLPRG